MNTSHAKHANETSAQRKQRVNKGKKHLLHTECCCEVTQVECLFLTSTLFVQIAGFINAIHPFCGDTENLRAFRFYALNPIVDPWVFIICRKSVFRHLRSVLSCRFSKGAVKTTAQNCALSLPLDSHTQRNPSDVTVQQTNTYSNLALWPSRKLSIMLDRWCFFCSPSQGRQRWQRIPFRVNWLWKEWSHLFLNVRWLMETVQSCAIETKNQITQH